jgi:protein gp37
MGENSKIEWTDYTWNSWMGCTKVSPGCKFCYAETMMDTRWGKVEWGPQGQRVRTSPANWKKPLAWFKRARKAGERRRVFTDSIADLFEHKPDQPEMDDWRAAVWNLVEATAGDADGGLDWLMLTKRPENVPSMVPAAWMRARFPAAVWIGTSVEDQRRADERIPHLLALPAAVRFLSVEPLLEPVDLWEARYLLPGGGKGSAFAWAIGVNWVIVGGESGHGARPMHPKWALDIRDQCAAAEVPFFFKQMCDERGRKLPFGHIPTVTAKVPA